MITGIAHICFTVSDLDRSIAFYRDVMGLEVIRILDCPPEMRLGDIVGMPGCTARIAHLRSKGGMLELFEYQNPRGRKIPSDRTQADHGLVHIGFNLLMAIPLNVDNAIAAWAGVLLATLLVTYYYLQVHRHLFPSVVNDALAAMGRAKG